MTDIESSYHSDDEEYVKAEPSTDTDASTRSSFESTNDLQLNRSFKKKLGKSLKLRTSKEGKVPDVEENEDWKNFVEGQMKHLMRSCKKKAKFTGRTSTIFAFINNTRSLFLILFSISTFIISSIKTEYDITDYILIGLSAIGLAYEGLENIFKMNEKSIYLRKASRQYRRINRKLNQYFYTSKNTDEMADFLSAAYHDYDRLDLEDHKANFNKFNKSYTDILRNLGAE
jgi:hypothetical protein